MLALGLITLELMVRDHQFRRQRIGWNAEITALHLEVTVTNGAGCASLAARAWQYPLFRRSRSAEHHIVVASQRLFTRRFDWSEPMDPELVRWVHWH